jgi:ElaB/YqjD/DUF883 family membrane-anchored ribosome-binding protein
MAQANEARKGPMDKANEAAQNAGKTVNETFETVKHRTQEAMQQATEKAGQASEKVQAWANQTFDSTAESMKGFGKEASDLVRKYPVAALIAGFGVGLLCGRIMRL